MVFLEAIRGCCCQYYGLKHRLTSSDSGIFPIFADSHAIIVGLKAKNPIKRSQQVQSPEPVRGVPVSIGIFFPQAANLRISEGSGGEVVMTCGLLCEEYTVFSACSCEIVVVCQMTVQNSCVRIPKFPGDRRRQTLPRRDLLIGHSDHRAESPDFSSFPRTSPNKSPDRRVFCGL